MSSDSNLNKIHTRGIACGQVAAESLHPANASADPSLYVELVNCLKTYAAPDERESFIQGYMVGVEIELLKTRKAVLEGCQIIRSYVDLHGQGN